MPRFFFRDGSIAIVAALLALSNVRASDIDYVPNNTELLVTVNWKQLVYADLVKADKKALGRLRAMLDQALAAHPALKLLANAGFEPGRDLDSLSFAGPPGTDPRMNFCILKGQFNVRKIEAAAEAIAKANPEKLKIAKVGRAAVYEVPLAGDRRAYASLVSDTTLIAATDREDLSQALARSAEGTKAVLKKEFRELLATRSDKQALSVVATGTALSKLMDGAALPNIEVSSAAVKALDGLSGAVTIGKNVQFQLGIHAREDDIAKKLVAAGDNALLTIRAVVEQKSKTDQRLVPVLELVKTLRIADHGANVVILAEASLDVIESLMKSFPND